MGLEHSIRIIMVYKYYTECKLDSFFLEMYWFGMLNSALNCYCRCSYFLMSKLFSSLTHSIVWNLAMHWFILLLQCSLNLFTLFGLTCQFTPFDSLHIFMLTKGREINCAILLLHPLDMIWFDSESFDCALKLMNELIEYHISCISNDLCELRCT